MNPTLLLTRCKEGKKKNIYFTSPNVRDLTMMNADRIAVSTLQPIASCSILNVTFILIRSSTRELKCLLGVTTKVPIADFVLLRRWSLWFYLNKVQIYLFILWQGALALMEYMTKRRVVVSKEDMILMLLNDDMDTPPEIHKFTPDAAKQLHEIGMRFRVRV